MTRRIAVVVIAMAVVLGAARVGQAATCTVAGVTHTCDVTCSPNCNFASGGCDQDSNGVCVLCGTTGANTMTGSSTLPNVLCGKGGDDVLTGGAGNDIIDGAGGNDTINADAGDDEVYGGAGVDTINGDCGNDTLNGGAGDDVIVGATSFACPSVHSVNICGGADDDDLTAMGFGHQCIDGGPGTDVCDYIAPVAPTGNKSVGSFRYCETETAAPPAVLIATDPPCGCWGDY